MKKLLLSAAVALAFGASSAANAAATIGFDIDGSGLLAGTAQIDNFDWSAANSLVLGAFSTAPDASGAINTQVVAQGALSVFQKIGSPNISPLAGTEFTFQASFFERATGIGTQSAFFSAGTGPSSFSIYYDPNAGVSAGNPLTGLGYGLDAGATLILHGTLTSLTGSFIDNTVEDLANNPIVLLDQLNGSQAGTVMTHQGSGSTTLRINVDFAHTDFFKSSITSLSIDMQDTTTNALPFSQTEPSDAVFGFVPFYTVDGGGPVNGAGGLACLANGSQDENGNVGTRCDLHLQSDGVSSFNPVPEPGSLALVGLSLGALGMIRRRKAML